MFWFKWKNFRLYFSVLRFPSCSVIGAFQMDTGTWMDMDRIPSSWLTWMERQFIANSIIRYMLCLGQGVKGSHHPHLLTSPEDWATIKRSSPLQPFLPSTSKDEKYQSIWLVPCVFCYLPPVRRVQIVLLARASWDFCGHSVPAFRVDFC